MRTQVPITAGIGTNIATDFIGGTHVQVMKLAAGATGTAEDVSESAPLPVSSGARWVDVALSLDTSAYAVGDVLADTQVVAGALRTDGLGWLSQITLIDEDDQAQGLDLLFFSANVSLGTENSAPTITDVNARQFIGSVRVSSADWTDLGGVDVATLYPSLSVKAAAGTGDIYVAAISRGTGTYTASGIRLRLHFILT